MAPPRKRGGRGKPSAPLLEKLGRQFEGIMRADIKGAFATFAKDVDYDAMADAVYSGDYRRVFQTIPREELFETFAEGLRTAGDALRQANAIEGQAVTRQLTDGSPQQPPPASRAVVPRRQRGSGKAPPPDDDFATFDLPEGGQGPDTSLLPTIDNDAVLGYVGMRTGDLIQDVTEDLQTNVQNAVAVGMTNNLSPRQVAGLIRDNLPLNRRQQGALDKYKAGLAETNLSKKRQTELIERYRNALVDERATTIARTETQYSINAGQQFSWLEAQRRGLIGYNATRIWQTEEDPCDVCAVLNGQEKRINEPFLLPNGRLVMTPPAHPRCRCAMRPGSLIS